jgi:hypothetical protein
MAVVTVVEFVVSLQCLPLLSAAQLDQLAELQQHFTDVKAMGEELIRRGWLTSFQANQIGKGKGDSLVLDRYILLDLLGQGGMGSVFKAKQTQLDRLVALKVIRPAALRSQGALERFQREARLAARLDHANIVTVYDNGECNGIHYLVMELIDGTDLAHMVKQHGSLPVPLACACIRQAALGLQHAHEQGLVHRDIKPHNLMLTTRGVVKVMDLGLARVANTGNTPNEGLTNTGTVMGTVDYMAPEQAANARTVDIRADIYSLGCTLYHLLAGQVPFPGGMVTEILIAHQLREPQPIESLRAGLPEGLGRVVHRMLAKNRADRFATPGEVAAALAPFTNDAADGSFTSHPSGTSPGSESVADPTAPECATPTATAIPVHPVRKERSRWLIGAAVAAGLVALLGVVLAMVLLRPPGEQASVAQTTPPRPTATRPVQTSPQRTAPAPVRPPHLSVFGLTATGFQTWADKVKADGYRITTLNGYETGGEPQFAATAVREPTGPPWRMVVGVSVAENQKQVNDLSSQGYHVMYASAYLQGKQPAFCSLWVKDDRRGVWELRSQLLPEQVQTFIAERRGKNLRPLVLNGYPDGQGGHRFRILWCEAGDVRWHALHDLTTQEYQAAFNEWVKKGYRPISVSGYRTADGPRLAAIFAEQEEGLWWEAHHDMSAEKLAFYQSQAAVRGERAGMISGYWDGSQMRYVAFWVREP